MSSPSRHVPFTTELESPLSRIGRALAGGHLNTIARTVFAHDGLRELLIHKMMMKINDECSTLCQCANPSLFRKRATSDLQNFKWETYVKELESKSPTLLRLLMYLVSHSDHRNEVKKSTHHYPAVCMTAAVVLKERNREMVGLQTYTALLLFSSRAHKQVCKDDSKPVNYYQWIIV